MTKTFKITLLTTAAAIMFPAQVFASNGNSNGKANESSYSVSSTKEKTNQNNGNDKSVGNANSEKTNKNNGNDKSVGNAGGNNGNGNSNSQDENNNQGNNGNGNKEKTNQNNGNDKSVGNANSEKTNQNNGNDKNVGNAKGNNGKDKDHEDNKDNGKGDKDQGNGHNEHGNGKGKGHYDHGNGKGKGHDKDHSKDDDNGGNNNGGDNGGNNNGGDNGGNNNGGDNGGNNNGGDTDNGNNNGGNNNGGSASVNNAGDIVPNEPAVLMSVAMAGMNSLHKRMGELRDNSSCDQSGVWVRAYIKHLELDDFVDSTSDIYGFEMGYDQKIDVDVEGVVYAGVMAGLTHTKKMSTKPGHGLRSGSGYGDTPSIGAYATWLSESGLFMDGTFRTYWSNLHMTTFTRQGAVKMNPNRQISAFSFEIGKQYEFARTDVSKWLFTPKFETLYAWADAKSFDTSNGQGIRMGHSQSILAKLTAEVAYNKKLDNGMIVEPFAHVALLNEFDGETNIRYRGTTYKSDLGGVSVEVGGGLNMQLNDSTALYSDVMYEKGDVVEAISANAGVRYTW